MSREYKAQKLECTHNKSLSPMASAFLFKIFIKHVKLDISWLD